MAFSMIKIVLVLMIIISFCLLIASISTNYWGVESKSGVVQKFYRGLWKECVDSLNNGTVCQKVIPENDPGWLGAVKGLMVLSCISFLIIFLDISIAVTRNGQTLKQLGFLAAIPVTETFTALTIFGVFSEMKLGWSFFAAMVSVPLPVLASTLAYIDAKHAERDMEQDGDGQSEDEMPATSGGSRIAGESN